MREVRETRLKLQRLKNNLLRTDQAKVMSDLTIFWKFIQADPFISPVISELKEFEFNFDAWEGECRQSRAYGFPHDERDRAAMCLAILNPSNYSSDREIWALSLAMHLASENNIAKMTQAFFEAFLPPLFEYVDERLLGRESMVSASDVMLDIQEALDPTKLTLFPKTAEALETAYRRLNSESGAVVWQNVGSSCRSALIAFANEVFRPDFLPIGEDLPKGDDAKRKIALTIRHYYTKNAAKGPYLDATERLVKDAWDLVSALTHRKDACESDARLAVMLTYLVVWYSLEARQNND